MLLFVKAAVGAPIGSGGAVLIRFGVSPGRKVAVFSFKVEAF